MDPISVQLTFKVAHFSNDAMVAQTREMQVEAILRRHRREIIQELADLCHGVEPYADLSFG